MRVTRITPDGQAWTAKSRPIFWEWFFLDDNSDFRRFLRQISRFGWDRVLGNSTVYSEDGFATGMARGVEPRELEATLDFYRGFGKLVSFAMAFGWSGLRPESLVGRTSDGLQLTELDEVFGDVHSTAEWISALEVVTGRAFTKLTLKELFAMIEGLRAGFGDLIAHRPRLEKFFDVHRVGLSAQPIRTTVRDPEVYLGVSAGRPIPNWLTGEELACLSRGEVPYFIYYPMRDGRIYCRAPAGGWVALADSHVRGRHAFLDFAAALAEARLRSLEKQIYEDWASRFVSPATFTLTATDQAREPFAALPPGDDRL